LITIRKGIEADIHKVSRLWVEMAKELRPDDTPIPEWWRAIAINMMRFNKEYYIFVADDNGKLVGFIDGIVVSEPSTGMIQGIGRHFYVKPEYRNNGIAWKLYIEICTQAKDRGAKAFTLSCLPDKVEFWKKRGFKTSEINMRMDL
jgi:GNAT superfamily N-acetyltransferase